MKIWNIWSGLILLFCCAFIANVQTNTDFNGVLFHFNGDNYALSATMRLSKTDFSQRGGLSRFYMDTVASCFYEQSGYVEILRQDNALRPVHGIALGFELDAAVTEFPYRPAAATIQIRDFTWGGVEFSTSDTLNYTGVTNDVSEDLFVEIRSFRNDTISGVFSGVLLSGAGTMALLDSGYFKVRLYRKN